LPERKAGADLGVIPAGNAGADDQRVIVGASVKLAHLRATAPFAGLSDRALASAVLLAEEVAVPAGYVLIYEGDLGDEVFVIADGMAAVVVDGHCAGDLGPGTIIGSVPPLRPPAAGATVVATSAMRFFVFDGGGFASLARQHPSIVA
jgi:CRP-like cAMP-binding protein